jgi:hypothetical protein
MDWARSLQLDWSLAGLAGDGADGIPNSFLRMFTASFSFRPRGELELGIHVRELELDSEFAPLTIPSCAG